MTSANTELSGTSSKTPPTSAAIPSAKSLTRTPSSSDAIDTRSSSTQVHLRRYPTQLAMETCSSESVRNSVLAGYAAGVSGTLVGHPFDSIKVWMQTRGHASSTIHSTSAPSPAASTSTTTTTSATTPSTAGSNSVASRIARAFSGAAEAIPLISASSRSSASSSSSSALAQRAKALYAGVTGPLMTVGIIQSVNFALYDSGRRMLYGWDHPDATSLEYLHHDSIANVAMASGTAGIVLCFVTSPLMMIKIKQQTTHLSFVQALKETMAPHGQYLTIRTMYVGFPLHMMSESFGRIVYYSTYESLKRFLVHEKTKDPASTNDYHGVVTKQPISLQERMICAAASGILCWSMIFPIDAVRSRMFAQPTQVLFERQSSSIAQMVRTMYLHQGGMKAFFRGYSVTVLRAGPVAAAVLPIYDLSLEYLSGL